MQLRTGCGFLQTSTFSAVANGLYVAETAEYRLVTVEPPFQVGRLSHQFESRHAVSAHEVVVDAGAFDGILMNIFAAQVGPSGRVLTFDSRPQTAFRDQLGSFG